MNAFMKSTNQPPVAKVKFEATEFASHDIWSETIVRTFTNLCLFFMFNSRDRATEGCGHQA